MEWRAWAVVLSAALFFFYEFILMNMFNALNPSLMAAFSISATKLGNLSAMYFYGNISFLFFAGILLDRFSTKRLLLTAIMVCVICTFLFSFSKALWQAELCRYFTGIASTLCLLSCVRLASRWFPAHRIALVIGCVVTMAMLGGLVAQVPMTLLVSHFGWQVAVRINVSLGVLFTFIIFWVVQDYPQEKAMAEKEVRTHLQDLGFFSSILLALKNRQNWLAGMYTNIMSFPNIVLGATWGIMYLTHVRNLTATEAASVTSMIFLGLIFGCPFMGWFSDAIQRRKLPMIICAILTLGILAFLMSSFSLTRWELMLGFFLLGFMISGQVITYPLIVESNPRAITNTAQGLACTLIMSAGLFQVVFGWFIDLGWTGAMANGLRVYSAENFAHAMWLFPAATLIALVLACFLKETHCRHCSE